MDKVPSLSVATAARRSSTSLGARVGINAIWRNEQGDVLGEVLDPAMLLSRFVGRRISPVADSKCLGFLDAYGDACFNQLQLPDLVHELRLAKDGINDPATVEHLSRVLGLAERAVGVHTYLWFEGD